MKRGGRSWSVGLLGSLDPVLLLALVLTLVFSLYGIRWGRVECWNRDEMAMRSMRGFRPSTYEKPPFHTYLNHVLVIWPLDAARVCGTFLTGRRVNLNEAELLQSRLLVIGMYLATVALAYWISRQCFGKNPARLIALLFATTAGFIEYDHFLSCDSPLLLWMMLAFFFARRIALYGDVVSYALAGFSTGLATATKYNGLAVGITIPVAHLLANYRCGWKKILLSRSSTLAFMMVAVGFIAGAPTAPFEWRRLIADFMYNAKVTPHYGGQVGGTGYLKFLDCLPEIFGWPGTYFVAVAAVISLATIMWRRTTPTPGTVCFTLSASVFFLYFAEIGGFPRMETRFVLPAAPFLILMCGPVLQSLTVPPALIFVCALPLLFYNAVCSLSIGYRLNRDPRLEAQCWIEHRAADRTRLVIESSGGSPHWIKLPAVNGIEWDEGNSTWRRTPYGNVLDLRMPHVSGRMQLFGQIFGHNSWVQRHAQQAEGDPDESLFTREQLERRNPDLITIYSSDYNVPSAKVKNYYADLLKGNAAYRIALDGKTVEAPPWIYPHTIDFLRGEIAILARTTAPANRAVSN